MNSPRADAASRLLSAAPMFPGKHRLVSAIGKMRCGIGTGEGRCISGGTVMQLGLRDRIQRDMWGGCYEPHVRRCLAALLRPGNSLLEVGAHIGYLTAFEAFCVGPGGRVFAFEADPENFSRLAAHVGGIPWVSVERKAVWRASETLTFERSATMGESGWGTLTTVRDLRAGDHVAVQAISLDDWKTAGGVAQIHGLKIDAEGSEIEILKGARDFLQSFAPWMIIESNQSLLEQAQASAEEMLAVLRDYGYRACALDGMKASRTHQRDSSRSDELLAMPAAAVPAAVAALARMGFQIETGIFS